MKLTACESGDLRNGDEFRFAKKEKQQAPSTFIAVHGGKVIITRRFSNLIDLPDDTEVVAHWHGQYRTEEFLSTIGKLKKKLVEQGLSK